MTVRKEEQAGAEPEIPVVHIDEVQLVDALEPIEVGGHDDHHPTAIASAVPIEQVDDPQQQSSFNKGPETIDVIAPTNMQEGYQFNVDAAGRMLRVKVPAGGVSAGQRFGAIIIGDYSSINNAGNNSSAAIVQDPHMIPHGRWRDDLCDCCRFGCCHPQCCLACWCGTCALGQVMTRLRLNWCGEFMNVQTPSLSTFKILLAITTIYVAFNWATSAVIEANDEDGDEYTTSGSEDEAIVIVSIVQDVVGFVFFIYALYITIRTRIFIRRKYEIPAKRCGETWEDCCCSCWCAPCTICQMARHTANYDMYHATCCSDTGLAAGAPAIV